LIQALDELYGAFKQDVHPIPDGVLLGRHHLPR
jgi:hypothetical protein